MLVKRGKAAIKINNKNIANNWYWNMEWDHILHKREFFAESHKENNSSDKLLTPLYCLENFYQIVVIIVISNIHNLRQLSRKLNGGIHVIMRNWAQLENCFCFGTDFIQSEGWKTDRSFHQAASMIKRENAHSNINHVIIWI